MSQSLSQLDPAVLEALMTMVRAKGPRNRPMTVAEVEAAVFELLQYLGSTLTQEAVAEQIAAAEKRGTGRPAAGRRCGGSGADRARS
jgi:hypothetical protein